MGVDARKDVYKGDKLVAEKTEVDIRSLPDVEAVLTIKPCYPEYNTPARTLNYNPSKWRLLPLRIRLSIMEHGVIPLQFTNEVGCVKGITIYQRSEYLLASRT